MMILPITRSWLDSRTARRVYLVCSVLALALAMTQGIGRQTLPPTTATIFRLVLFPEVVGTALLQVAMLYFWFGFDQSSWLKRALWFPFLFLFIPLTHALYYFFVYRKLTCPDPQTSTANPPLHS
jgi:hypothetical protein